MDTGFPRLLVGANIFSLIVNGLLAVFPKQVGPHYKGKVIIHGTIAIVNFSMASSFWKDAFPQGQLTP